MAEKSNYCRSKCLYSRLQSERYFTGMMPDRERISLTSLEIITDALLEIMEVYILESDNLRS